MKERAYAYLRRDRLHHIDMLETMDRGNAELVYAERDGVLLLSVPSGTYMMSADSEATLEKMCALIPEPELITAHQAEFVSLLQEKYGFIHRMDCLQCSYLHRESLDERAAEDMVLRPLTMEELEFVIKNYDHPTDEEYIKERIEVGMIGAFCGGELAGFIGIHAEGTMGMLQVLPAFRRRGIAYSLEAALINRQLGQGFVPSAYCDLKQSVRSAPAKARNELFGQDTHLAL